MASINKVILIGNLGRDPEVRYTTGGTPVANFSMATTDRWNDPSGEKKERTEWHKIVVWAKQAEFVGNYLKKGNQVYVEGSLQTREWTDRDGNKRYTTEVKAQVVQGLGGRGDGPRASASSAEPAEASSGAPTASEPEGTPSYSDDDIPF